jgi:GMP synthase-like glutamine amidotransferase
VSEPRCLVVENDHTDDARRLGDWLAEAGLDLDVVRPHAGDPLPDALDGVAALVVLGGEQRAYPGPGGERDEPWFAKLEQVLRSAVRARVPTLAVCLGAQLLAQAHAGTVAPAAGGPEIGADLVAKRDVAEQDALFGLVPMMPDVFQWHYDEVSELPLGAVLLAASPRSPHQAFRVGDRAWGLQFHIECDLAMVESWARPSAAELAGRGLDADEVVAGAAAVLGDIEDVWQPFAVRFAALARGELVVPAGRELPLLGG